VYAARVTTRFERLAGLDTQIAGDPAGDGPVVVLLHGFGAPGDDLVPLARWLDAPPGTRFVFPEAPLEIGGLYGDSRAWWMLDLESLGQGPIDRADEIPDGLAPARAHVIALLDAVRDRFGVRDDRVLLGGFSQGAMLSLDVALHTDRAFAGLILLSGTILAEAVWAPRMAARRGLKVLQSHGDRDELLSFPAAERLRDMLTAAGLDVEWHAFHGAHEIPPDVLRAAGRFATRQLT
jgi:phospholipase/carboxylesterase